jgi:hypothetical protein
MQALGDEADEAVVHQRAADRLIAHSATVVAATGGALQRSSARANHFAVDAHRELEALGGRDETFGHVRRAPTAVAHAQQHLEVRAGVHVRAQRCDDCAYSRKPVVCNASRMRIVQRMARCRVGRRAAATPAMEMRRHRAPLR